MQRQLNLFKGLFQPYENISILHINNAMDFLTPTIQEVTTNLNGHLHTIAFINQNSAKLSGKTREYEYIILGDILSHCTHANKILGLMYKALENSANIIILENKSHKNIEHIKDLLDKAHFVAINDIDLFENHTIITAKKLHMWGAGL